MARAIKLIYFSLLWLCSHALLSPGSNNSTDELALLSFKSKLSLGPSSFLASWNTSSHFCSWPGVVCGRRHPDRVVALRMGSFNLSGCISPFLGNLSFLKELDLHDNQLAGLVPSELGRLIRLQVLNMSNNHLKGSIPVTLGGCTKLTFLDLRKNQLQGEIPYEIGTMKNLVYLHLGKNELSGAIPRSLANLLSIEYLNLRSNRLSGEIPPSVGNLTNLQHLGLHRNMLSGYIPSSLGMLSSLSDLILGFNNLSGLIPTSLWNISSLTTVCVQNNMLSGTIPPCAFDKVPHLWTLIMDHNQFHGHIPASISNASNIMILQLGMNHFGGIVPPGVGSLNNLNWLQLSETLLQAEEPKDWEFITALTNVSQLQELALSQSKFGGVLPDSLSNLSASLIQLSLDGNNISGSIPKDIGNINNLQSLSLGDNFFTGSLPSSMCRLKNLGELYVEGNKISGPVPLALGNLTGLNSLHLDDNDFCGTIPSTLGNLTTLSELGLSDNHFIGSIPSAIFVPSLSIILDLSNNNLQGSLPQEIGNLENIVLFRAKSNKLSGEIPSTIGKCQLLQHLILRNNSLNGTIPLSLSQLKGLQGLDLSSNNLFGTIPKSLGNSTQLYFLNLSFNNFVGEVPDFGVFANITATSIQGNAGLCGGIPVIPILVRATDGFSAANLLGSGSFGSVYKGDLNGQEGKSTNLVAVKLLKLQTPKALRSSTAECEALRNMRHRNLVKIITVCSSIDTRGNDFKAIVYDFMSNGSLEGWIHPDTNSQTAQRYLNLSERVTILLDVANALDYLHCHGPEPVVHCDLKPSNVLLDADMVAHVGDFGLAKIVVGSTSMLQQSTSSIGFRGTVGYAAPEYGAGNMVSTHGDIYSYGVLVLETVTGKRPTDSRFGQGLSLREYTNLALHNGVMDAVDTPLSSDLENELRTLGDLSYKRKMDCVVSLLRLGMSCTHELPSSRMPTGGIIRELLAIRDSLLREHRT
ncbi:hypothetical protein ACP70R_008291 [Stipagrostis hirtigluma subsp. patula]